MPRSKQQRAENRNLPGRANKGVVGRKAAVEHYAQMINERSDLTEAEKRQAIAKYRTGMGVEE